MPRTLEERYAATLQEYPDTLDYRKVARNMYCILFVASAMLYEISPPEFRAVMPLIALFSYVLSCVQDKKVTIELFEYIAENPELEGFFAEVNQRFPAQPTPQDLYRWQNNIPDILLSAIIAIFPPVGLAATGSRLTIIKNNELMLQRAKMMIEEEDDNSNN